MPDVQLQRPDFQRAENAALRLLNEAGLYEPPVNPVEIARALGVKVNFVRFSGSSDGVAGLYDPATDSILVNMEEAGVRQTFTVAHELGHRVLHKAWAESDSYKVLWRDSKRYSNDRWEQEANKFAATLLMPRGMVEDYKNLSLGTFAKIFAVSEQAAGYRLQNLYGF